MVSTLTEVSGITLLAVFLWVVTGIFTLLCLNSTYGDTIKAFGILAILMGTVAFILTLIGTGIIEVI